MLSDSLPLYLLSPELFWRLACLPIQRGTECFSQAYAAVFLGMTAFKAGIPNIWGTFVGSLSTGRCERIDHAAGSPYFQDIVTG
jgi:ribose transport system permease protein